MWAASWASTARRREIVHASAPAGNRMAGRHRPATKGPGMRALVNSGCLPRAVRRIERIRIALRTRRNVRMSVPAAHRQRSMVAGSAAEVPAEGATTTVVTALMAGRAGAITCWGARQRSGASSRAAANAQVHTRCRAAAEARCIAAVAHQARRNTMVTPARSDAMAIFPRAAPARSWRRCGPVPRGWVCCREAPPSPVRTSR